LGQYSQLGVGFREEARPKDFIEGVQRSHQPDNQMLLSSKLFHQLKDNKYS